MKIAVAKEIDPSEPRVAASPDTVKKFKALGVDIAIEPGAGIKSGLPARPAGDQVRKIAIMATMKITEAVPYLTSMMKPS